MSGESTFKCHHLYRRVEYPMERGYRMEPYPLPDWIHITISTENGDKRLTVHSRIHVNKETKVGPSYHESFSYTDIVKDLSGEIGRRFL